MNLLLDYLLHLLPSNVFHFLHCSGVVNMMTAPKMLAIMIVALYLQSYHTKVLLVQTHDGTENAPNESIKKLKTKAGHQSIQNKALGLPKEKPG